MKRFAKLSILVLTFAFLAGSKSMAVPNLQLFSPDGTYDAITETWVVGGGTFEIWVVVANLDKRDFYDITLVAALAQGTLPSSGYLEITPMGESMITLTGSDFTYGTPPAAVDTDPLPSHGIYPTFYNETLVTSLLQNGDETVLDYQPGEGGSNNFGKIFIYTITTSYEFVHFDGYAFKNDADGRRVFAPFSHDVEVVPEPTTMALFGLGLLGTGIARRFRRKKS